MKNIGFVSSILIFVGVLIGTHSCDSGRDIQPLTKSWEIAVPNQDLPQGIASLSASYCGSCHQQHYQEWQLSTHAHAWTDLQFQAELKKESSPFMCINCHIPLQNQQEYIVTGLVDGDIYQPVKELNPKFDADLQQEGINCASCHVREGAIVGPTGSPKAPHKTVKNPEFLSENLCISCHNASAVVTPTLACSFETGDEWKSGPFSDKRNCISCHMEELEREVVAGFGKRKSHLHYFAGSGIPKFDTVRSIELSGLLFIPSKVHDTYHTGDSLNYSLSIKNEFAGHNVPTGDPERFYSIKIDLLSSMGDTLAKSHDRIGEEWQWWPTAQKLSDNNLKPGENRKYQLQHVLKTGENAVLYVRVTKHRLNQPSADYNQLGPEYPLFIEVFNKSYPITVVKN